MYLLVRNIWKLGIKFNKVENYPKAIFKKQYFERERDTRIMLRGSRKFNFKHVIFN